MIPRNAVRGAELLDERLPGWADEIDLDRLDVSNGCDCVYGQLFGDYERGERLMGVDSKKYGFMQRGRQRYDLLTAGWRRLVAARQTDD